MRAAPFNALHDAPAASAMTLYACLRPALFALDPERAHRLTLHSAALLAATPGGLATLSTVCRYEHPALALTALGLRFTNPLGLAAGFDKDGELATPLAALGFGFLELGTVTPRPQPGNPRPRLFRLPEDGAVINRMGFNNGGASALAERLRRLPARPVPLGVNLGKNKDTPMERAAEDYVAGLRAVREVADYLVVNVSSPNTPGLRSLQQADELGAIVRALRGELDSAAVAARRPPLLVKLAPDLDRESLERAVQAAVEAGAEGLIATNTTLRRDGLKGRFREEAGGLSGRPLFPLALETVRRVYSLVRGRVPLVGVGGISSPEDAYAFICAGAGLVQVYTALVYQGPGLVPRFKRGLVRLLERDGFRSIAEAVGADAK
jgi:dihydroorotate dehydrogenase